MNEEVLSSFKKLKDYCEKEQFKGWDPYDGLNSRVFQALPFFKNSAICRLAVIQFFKRCPINFRRIAMVPKGYNAKGIGLFLQGYCNLVKIVEKNPELEKKIGSKEDLLAKVSKLAELLISLQSKGNYHGACWGYNFDWQARTLFFFPKGTPTVVATTFCATALFDAYEITKNEKYRDLALSSAKFVIDDLHRYTCSEGFLFSYSTLQGNDTVINASLLGSKLLSYCYRYTGNEDYYELAKQSVRACCCTQENDGSWVYGLGTTQGWIDSFHTGYNLDALIAYEEQCGDNAFHDNIEKGFEFYIRNFFEKDGVPKYYHNQTYPIDIHCPGQLCVSLSRMHRYGDYKDLVDNVLSWTIKNMQDKSGYFYYQRKKSVSSKISYTRWSNAFMFNAMSYYWLEKIQID